MVNKLPEHTKDFPMKVICAWCDDHLYWSRCHLPNKVSHGICPDCARKQYEEQLEIPGMP